MVYHRTLNIATGNSWLSPTSSCRRASTAYHLNATNFFTSLSLFMMFSHLVMPTPSSLFLSFLLSHFLYYFCQEAFLNSLHAPWGLLLSSDHSDPFCPISARDVLPNSTQNYPVSSPSILYGKLWVGTGTTERIRMGICRLERHTVT